MCRFPYWNLLPWLPRPWELLVSSLSLGSSFYIFLIDFSFLLVLRMWKFSQWSHLGSILICSLGRALSHSHTWGTSWLLITCKLKISICIYILFPNSNCLLDILYFDVHETQNRTSQSEILCSTSFFIFCIKVLEHHHWQRISLWLNSSGLSELSSQMADFRGFQICLFVIQF